MMKDKKMRCIHSILGYPGNSKKGWELRRIDPDEYCCTCKEGRKKHVCKSILTEDEWNGVYGHCRYCNKPLIPLLERVYFVTCSMCREKLYL